MQTRAFDHEVNLRLLLLPFLILFVYGDCQPDARVAPASPRAGAAAGERADRAVERTTSDWLSRLPDGEVKRRFILDCAGCHPLDDAIMTVAGRSRTHEEWVRAVDLMLSF